MSSAPSPFAPRQLLRSMMSALLPSKWFMVRGHSSDSICLTFDDGPDPAVTPKVLDLLNREGVKATFFVIGARAQANQDLLKRIALEGHTIAHHSFLHADHRSTSAQQLVGEINQTNTVLESLGLKPSTLFRPPFGKVTFGKCLALWRHKMTIVLWNRDPKDFEKESAADITQWLIESPLRPGDIVLLHDNVPHVVETAQQFIRAARSPNLNFATIDQWVSNGAAKHSAAVAH